MTHSTFFYLDCWNADELLLATEFTPNFITLFVFEINRRWHFTYGCFLALYILNLNMIDDTFDSMKAKIPTRTNMGIIKNPISEI